MTEHSVSRTLVKSPPELWAELSDPASLARHLGEFGEITITRLEPEHTVAWEGERARGTVALEPAGWGTKVTLEALVEGDAPEEAVAEEEAPSAEPPAVVEELPAAEVEPAPADPAPRPGFLARLFGRRRRPAAPAAQEAVAAEEEPVAEEPAPHVRRRPPAPTAEPAPPEPDDGLPAVLSAALDALGAAHHRPFSRG
jgi:hypothetical protein